MSKFSAILKRKVLGVPLVYIAAAVVLALVAYAIKTKDTSGSAADTADADQTPADNAEGDATGTNQPIFVANPSTTPVSPDAATTNPVIVDDNDAWLKRGVQWLIQGGYATAGDAQTALSRYLNGDTLSYDQGHLRDAVVKQYGLPPEPPQPGVTAGKPATRQFSHFPGIHTVQGSSDNSYGKLARLYYGREDNQTIDLLQSKNTALGHAGPFAKGTKVNIPAYRPPKYYRATSAKHTLAQIAAANGITQAQLQELNDTVKFPVKVGTRVRVG